MQSRYSGYADGEFDTYWFEKNLQGDIIAVYDEDGTKLVEYLYDAWGNFTTEYFNLGEYDYALDFNPFRYRGYYYDEETGFYYLNSRYYDPVTGRFINPDNIAVLSLTPDALTDKNLYAYCDNNPVMRADHGGEFWNLLIGAAVGATISLVSSVISEVIEGNWEWKDVGQIFISTTIGAAEGALIALAPQAAAAISFVASAADTAINGIIEGDEVQSIVVNSITSGAIGALSGAGGSGFAKGGKLINNAADSIGKISKKGVHPVVKKAANKTVTQARRYILKTYISGQFEDFAYGGISQYSSWYINTVVDAMSGG